MMAPSTSTTSMNPHARATSGSRAPRSLPHAPARRSLFPFRRLLVASMASTTLTMQTDAELKAAADAKAKAQLAVIRQKVADARARAFEEAKSGTDPNPRRHASASGVEFDENATAAVTDNGKSVDFRVHMECEFGDGVLVCGSTDQLGNWNTDHALRLEWSEGDVWTANTSMSPEEIERAELKVVRKYADGRVEWADGENESIATRQTQHSFANKETPAFQNSMAQEDAAAAAVANARHRAEQQVSRRREAEQRAQAFAAAKEAFAQNPESAGYAPAPVQPAAAAASFNNASSARHIPDFNAPAPAAPQGAYAQERAGIAAKKAAEAEARRQAYAAARGMVYKAAEEAHLQQDVQGYSQVRDAIQSMRREEAKPRAFAAAGEAKARADGMAYEQARAEIKTIRQKDAEARMRAYQEARGVVAAAPAPPAVAHQQPRQQTTNNGDAESARAAIAAKRAAEAEARAKAYQAARGF